MSPSGSRMQIGGISAVATPFCRCASRSSAAGWNTEIAFASLFVEDRRHCLLALEDDSVMERRHVDRHDNLDAIHFRCINRLLWG